MFTFLAHRLLQLIPTLFFVSIIIFGLQQLLPGDPATTMAGEERDPEAIAAIKAKYHLDEPIPLQYYYWITGVLRGDLGESLRIKEPVARLVLQKLPVTAQLAGMAIVIALTIGISMGVISAVKKDTVWDYVANVIALWGISTPNFWLGILFIFLFSMTLGILPAGGYVSPGENFWSSLAHMIMPAFVLGNAIAAVIMRHTRSAMLQVLAQDYVRTARAKGLFERKVIMKHAFRNALTPVITLGALELGTLLSGAVLTEQIFTVPGFGKLVVDAVFNRDYFVIQGVVLVTATVYITLNLLADVAYVLVNPRLPELIAVAVADALVIETAAAEPMSPARRALRRLLKRKGAVVGLVVVLLMIAVAVLAPYIAPFDPTQQNYMLVRKPPSPAHWFGTDESGRDILSRVIWGARASLMAGVISVSIALAVGVPIGLAAGYVGGWLDSIISRITDAMLAIPFLILAIALAAFLGESLGNVMIAIGITATPIFIRLTRGQVIGTKVEDYIEAARALGNPHYRVALRHVFPNIVPPLLVQATLAIAAAIIAEASLAFLGLGQQPPAPSWGFMLFISQNFFENAPWMAIWPGAAIFVTVLAFNLFGDGLRDALDPKQAR